MTNEELKQEAIKKAYGNEWDLLPQVAIECAYNNNGWIFDAIHKPRDLSIDRHEFILNFKWRPKSLAGIENNNGWIRIKEDGSNLPKHLLWLSDLRTVWQGCLFIDFDNQNIRINTAATHYQPITKPELPIY